MRYALVAILLMAVGTASVGEANQNFKVVLHARTGTASGSCTETDVPNCIDVLPRTQVAPGEAFRLYILVNDYVEFQAFQTCITWPADWVHNPNGEPPLTFPCTVDPLWAHEPQGDGQGPNGIDAVDGTYAASFDCVTGPAVAVVVRIDFLAGQSGCLTQINPAQGSERIEIDDCASNPPGGNQFFIDASTAEGQLRLGSICVGTPGRDTCDRATAVEPATWGHIKASYR